MTHLPTASRPRSSAYRRPLRLRWSKLLPMAMSSARSQPEAVRDIGGSPGQDAHVQRLDPGPTLRVQGLRGRSAFSTRAAWKARCTGKASASTTARRDRRDAGGDPDRGRRSTRTDVSSPDPGVDWYHPHIREDYNQELGLYGNIVVVPPSPTTGRRSTASSRSPSTTSCSRRARSLPSAAPARPTRRWAASATCSSSTARRCSHPSRAGRSCGSTDQYGHHLGLQRRPARREDEASRWRQRPLRTGGDRGGRHPGSLRTGCRRRPARAARSIRPRAPHPGDDLPAGNALSVAEGPASSSAAAAFETPRDQRGHALRARAPWLASRRGAGQDARARR